MRHPYTSNPILGPLVCFAVVLFFILLLLGVI